VDDAWGEVDRWFEQRLVEPVAGFDAGGLPPHEVTPSQGKLLCLLASMAGAHTILELGTLAGYSTIWLARSGAQVVTLESNAEYASVARSNLERAGVADSVDLRLGPALETLAGLDGPFDLIFIDADKKSNPDYLREALRLSQPGTVIVADNVVRSGAVLDPGSDDPSVQGVQRFVEMVAAEPRLTATAIQTVGVKGYDGFLLALVGGPGFGGRSEA
jgi:predicted O-methyltransferase YrrM